MADAGVIIKADLKEEDLTRKIDKLVQDVDNKFKDMADKVDASIQKVANSLGNFKTIAQTNVREIKDAFQQLGTTFDQFARAMERAAAAASGVGGRGGFGGGGTGGGTGGYPPNTIGWLEEQIELQKKALKNEQLRTVELQSQVDRLEKLVRLRQRETTGSIEKSRQSVRMIADDALSKGDRTLKQAQDKLYRIHDAINKYKSEASRLGVTWQDLLPQRTLNALNNALDKTTEKIAKLKNEAKKPVTTDEVLSMPSKTIDEITAKMKAIRRVQATLPEESSGIQQLNREYDALKRKKDELLGKNSALIKSNSALARSFNYIKNRLAFALTVGAITNFTKQLIEVRGQYELLERSLGVLTGSMQRGSEIFSELNAMAIRSPFTLIELGTAAKQLTAYNFKANEVVNTTKRLADISAALGVPMERLVYNLGQIRAQTVLTARDARDFANAGLAIVPELAKYYTQLEGKVVSTSDVFDRMKKKAVSYNDVMVVLNKVTDEGGQFFDFQAKQAGTLKVQLANLNLAWNNMLNSIGKSNQGMLSAPIKMLRSLFQSWDSLSAILRDVAIGYGLVKTAQIAIILTTRNTTLAVATAAATSRTFVHGLTSIKTGLASLMSSPMTWWMLLATSITSVITTLIDANSEIKEFNNELRKIGEENVKNITKFLDDYSEVRKKVLNTNGEKVSEGELKKTWEALKEQIELTSGASSIFIDRLMSIENVNERVKASFNYLETIRTVSAAIERLGEKDILVQQDYSKWWNLGTFYDSLYENVKDYTEAQQRANATTEEFLEKHLTLGNSIEDAFYSADAQLKTLKENIETTHQSLLDFINDKGWGANVDAVNEAYGQIGRKIIQKGMEEKGWTPDDVFNFQLEWEEKRSQAAKKALELRIDNEQKAYSTAENEKTAIAIKAQHDRDKEQLDSWEQNNGRGKIIWAEFCKWMNETQSSEVQSMYNKFTKNGTQAIDYTSKEWMEWTQKMAKKFAEDHHLAQDDVFHRLYKWIATTKNWDIFIKLHIVSDDTKSVYDTLKDADKAADEAYGKVKRLGEELDRLNKKRKKSKDVVEQSFIDKDIERTTKEQTEAQKEYNEAIEKGGKSKSEEAAAKKRDAAANKANARARREQAKAESELQKAFRNEIQIIDKAQKEYNDLTKAGLSRQDALRLSTSGFEKSISQINSVFKKWGIETFDLSKYAGVSNPREILNMLQKQLQRVIATGKAKPEEIKELEVKIKDLKLDAEKFDKSKIINGLNNELGKIKEEYELAVELDANPELGEMFAQSFGIDTTDFPKTVQEAVDRMQDAADKAIAESEFGQGIDIDPDDIMHPFNILQDDIETWAKETGQGMESELVKKLMDAQKQARDLVTKDAKQTIQDWQKLLEKYAEYETKKAEIQRKAEQEREAARKHGASQEIFDAIDLKELREIEKLNFDEFQKSATWITATGDISNLTNKALQLLIDKLWEYKRSAKNLDPKEIIRLNNALRKLRKEQKKDNPFAAWSIMLDEAKQRMEQYEPDIDELTRKIQNLLKKQVQQHGILSDEDNQTLAQYIKNLQKLREEQNEVGKLTLGDKLGAIQKYSNAIKEIADSIINIADGFGAEKISKAAEALKDALSIVDKAKAGYELGGQYGAIVGAVFGITEMLIKWFDTNEDINEQIEYSQRQVKKLENQYKELQHAMENAYGAAKYQAQQAMIYNKKLQLAQLEEQLRLEKSRKGKHKDEDAIISLEGQIIDLKNEIHDAVNDIVEDLLGISSVGDAAENMVKSMIEAFKNGEDYMKVFEESFDDMIDNMIAKTVVSRLIGDFVQGIFDQIKTKKMGTDNAQIIADNLSYAQSVLDGLYQFAKENGMSDLTKKNIEHWENTVKMLQDAYNNAIMPTPEDVEALQAEIAAGKASIKEGFEAWMAAFGINFGQNASDTQLSALQQGIQGITEDTAGALEAYMNGVSQQVYYQSDILTQIRDILINFGGDVTIATNAQILLQLQNGYILMQTMTSLMQGWTNPSGNGIRVELLP